MKSYTVEEISKMLGKNPETVRRWIRSGKLKATQDSRKKGNLVTETELSRFLNTSGKLAAVAGGLLAVNPFLGIGAAAIGGAAAFHDYFANKKSNDVSIERLNKEYLQAALDGKIIECRGIIKKKQAEITALEEEIKEQRRLETECMRMLNQLQESMEENSEENNEE